MFKENIILADCTFDEIEEFVKGMNYSNIKVYTKICNGKRSLINEIKRYIYYAFFPFAFFKNRRKYDYIFGWQQFFAIFYSFFCKIFKVEKVNKIVILNFTYKEKKGILGKIYKKFMNFSINNSYVDFIHVPSFKYAKKISEEFDIDMNKFIITNFGINDVYTQKCIDELDKPKKQEFILSIGRSNRDYNYLIKMWQKGKFKEKLIIVSDIYEYKGKLPDNIIILNNVVGNDQFKYLYNAMFIIIPLSNENLCSGDTVLLTSMCLKKAVVVTTPSTLGEMYIEDGINGVLIQKQIDDILKIKELINNKEKRNKIGSCAREIFLKKYSRFQMGKNVKESIIER